MEIEGLRESTKDAVIARLMEENERLREAIEKSLTILPSCAADCKKPIKEALEGGKSDV